MFWTAPQHSHVYCHASSRLRGPLGAMAANPTPIGPRKKNVSRNHRTRSSGGPTHAATAPQIPNTTNHRKKAMMKFARMNAQTAEPSFMTGILRQAPDARGELGRAGVNR